MRHHCTWNRADFLGFFDFVVFAAMVRPKCSADPPESSESELAAFFFGLSLVWDSSLADDEYASYSDFTTSYVVTTTRALRNTLGSARLLLSERALEIDSAIDRTCSSRSSVVLDHRDVNGHFGNLICPLTDKCQRTYHTALDPLVVAEIFDQVTHRVAAAHPSSRSLFRARPSTIRVSVWIVFPKLYKAKGQLRK